MDTTPPTPRTSPIHGGARWTRQATHTLWLWARSLSWIAVGALVGAGIVAVCVPLGPPTPSSEPTALTFGAVTVRLLVSQDAHGMATVAITVASMVACFLAGVHIRGDSRSLAARGERSAWVGGSVGHAIARHGVACLVLLAAVIVGWGIAHTLGLMTAAVLVAALPVLAFLTSPGAFLFAGGAAVIAHAGMGGWAGLAAVPVSSPLVPLFLATAWLIFSSADPTDRFAHWWPIRRDVVGPLLALVWRRMDAATFERLLDAALVDARGLWGAQGIALTQPVRIAVHRVGTGVQIVADTGARPIVACVATALGHHVAGRIPPAGPPWIRTLPADSAHTQMAIAARAGTTPRR